jgi:hypothetical protein
VRIRTVLDARPGKPRRYFRQTLLLAHSWATLRETTPLEIVVIGTLPRALRARLRELGVETTSAQPHPLDPVSKYANKLLALREPSDAAVLLVDNDVVFLEDVSNLQGRKVRASVASTNHISEEQWEHIAATTGREPLMVEWTSLSDQVQARRKGSALTVRPRLFLNGGVIWVRGPAAFEPLWAANIAAIAHVFADHPLAGDDQVGFATAVAEHGGFDLLPYAYNWRTRCFQLGVPETPKVLHLSNLFAESELAFSDAVTVFWEARVIKQIRRLERRSGGQGIDQLLDEAVRVRSRVLDIVAEAGLDAFSFPT